MVLSNISAITSGKTSQKNNNPGYDKFLLGLTGVSISSVIGGLGIIGLKSRISLQAIREETSQKLVDNAPVKSKPIESIFRINGEALKKIGIQVTEADYEELNTLLKGDVKDADNFVAKMNERIKLHNQKCDLWRKKHTRKYLADTLKEAKRGVIRNKTLGGILLGIALAGLAQTAYYCSK